MTERIARVIKIGRRTALICDVGGMNEERRQNIGADDALFIAGFALYSSFVICAAERVHLEDIFGCRTDRSLAQAYPNPLKKNFASGRRP